MVESKGYEISMKDVPKDHLEKVQKESVRDIFRPGEGATWWELKRLNMAKWVFGGDYRHKRYQRIHVFLKSVCFHFGLKIIDKYVGRYMVKELKDIPETWYNNHLRMFYNRATLAIDDIWKFMVFKTSGWTKQYQRHISTPEELLEYVKSVNYHSYRRRRGFINALVTEMCEDTFFTTWKNAKGGAHS